MVFKGRFFSSKKSGSSSPDGSNSPRSIGSNSPVRSEKKKVKSTRDESHIGSTSTGFKGSPKKKDVKNRDSPHQEEDPALGQSKPGSSGLSGLSPSSKSRKAGDAREVGSSTAAAAAASPILAS